MFISLVVGIPIVAALGVWLLVRWSSTPEPRRQIDRVLCGLLFAAVVFALVSAYPTSPVSWAWLVALPLGMTVSVLRLATSAWGWKAALQLAGLDRSLSFCLKSTLTGRALGTFFPSTLGLDAWLITDAVVSEGRSGALWTLLPAWLAKKIIGVAGLFFAGLLVLPLASPEVVTAASPTLWSLAMTMAVLLGVITLAVGWLRGRAGIGQVGVLAVTAILVHALTAAIPWLAASLVADLRPLETFAGAMLALPASAAGVTASKPTTGLGADATAMVASLTFLSGEWCTMFGLATLYERLETWEPSAG